MLKILLVVLLLFCATNAQASKLSDEEIQDFHDALNVIAEAERWQSLNTEGINKYKIMNEDVSHLLKAKLTGSSKTKIEDWEAFTKHHKDLAKKHSNAEIEFYNKNKNQLMRNGCYQDLQIFKIIERLFPTEQRAYFYAGRAYQYGFKNYCEIEATGAIVSGIESGSHDQVYNRKKSYLLGERVLELSDNQYFFIQKKYGKYK